MAAVLVFNATHRGYAYGSVGAGRLVRADTPLTDRRHYFVLFDHLTEGRVYDVTVDLHSGKAERQLASVQEQRQPHRSAKVAATTSDILKS